jgi:hypothetical protein
VVETSFTLFAAWTPVDPGENGEDGRLPFIDVNINDWFYDYVDRVYTLGIMRGMTDTTFGPQIGTTRGMIATMIYRLENEPSVSGLANPFSDVAAGQWYEAAIRWGYANNLLEGYGDSTFGPNDLVTREQLAAILHRYLNFARVDIVVTMEYIIFADADQISGFASDPIQTLHKLDILRGTGTNAAGLTIINPRANATRAEVAAMFVRFIDVIER